MATRLFDGVFELFGPEYFWGPLVFWAVILGALAVVVYRFASDQAAIRRTKDGMRSSVLAIRLFPDEPRVILRSLGGVVVGSLAMFRWSVVPLLLMVGPFLFVLGHLSQWYERRPLEPGEAAVLTVRLATESSADDTAGGNSDGRGSIGLAAEAISLVGDDRVVVETPAVRLVREGEVVWRIRGQSRGVGVLTVRSSIGAIATDVPVGAFSPVRSVEGAGFFDAVFHPWGWADPAAAGIARLSVTFPERSGWLTGSVVWVFWLTGLSIGVACVVKRLAGVEM